MYMKNKINKLFALICIGLTLFAVSGCDNTKGSKPMLKITTSTAVGNYFSKTNYFIVYENGAVKKTEEFTPSSVINYYFISNDYGSVAKRLYNLDINSQEGQELKMIADNIVLLMDETKLKVISINELFFLEGRYFFDVLCDNGKGPISSKLFEYFPDDNSIRGIVSFNSKGIKHVELYES